MFVQWDREASKVIQGPQGTAGPGENWYPMVTIGGNENLRHYETKYELNEDAGIVLEIITDKAVSYGVLRSQSYDSLRCLLYTSPSPRDGLLSRMPSSA